MSANSFILAPEIAPVEIPPTWTCPITGFIVPKERVANLQYRAALLRRAEKDVGFQRELYTASAHSLLLWTNVFVFTYRVFEGDAKRGGRVKQAEQAHVPFITWPVQDEHMLALEHAINNAYSMLTDKTREMGASWSHAAVIDHQYRFRPDSLFLELSRVEEDVDDPGNPKALFVKHDYIYQWLPSWMRERRHRKKLRIANLDNGSRIDGSSSNHAAGSGDRRRAVLLDEFAKVDNATKIKGSLRDVSPCLLPNSTPYGPGTAYSKWRKSGQIKVFLLPWWRHPEKSAGLYVRQEADGKWKVRSPWYDHEETIRSPQEMAQEVDMDHLGSGATFFEATEVEQHRTMFAREPVCTRSIDFKKGTATDAIPHMFAKRDRAVLEIAGRGKWRIWQRLVDGRLDQTRSYIMGIDISKGQGASNSVISVLCAETREKVAEYACATMPPYDLARIAVAAALWIGGARDRLPLMIWEMNGPGWDFGRQVVKVYRYPFFYVDRVAGTVAEKRGKRYGWHSNRDKKEALLGGYRRSLVHGGFINHSGESLDEALTYIYYENGGIGPADFMDESSEARKTHGDRVIADALCLLGVDDAPKPKNVGPGAPARSSAWRREQAMKKRKRATKSLAFDFRGAS